MRRCKKELTGGTNPHLDASDDVLLLEDLDEIHALVGLLVKGLLKENNTGDVLLNVLGLEEKLSVLSSVVFGVLDIDRTESSTDGASGLIGSEDALARSSNGSGGGD